VQYQLIGYTCIAIVAVKFVRPIFVRPGLDPKGEGDFRRPHQIIHGKVDATYPLAMKELAPANESEAPPIGTRADEEHGHHRRDAARLDEDAVSSADAGDKKITLDLEEGLLSMRCAVPSGIPER
jgi:hypothetical protein